MPDSSYPRVRVPVGAADIQRATALRSPPRWVQLDLDEAETLALDHRVTMPPAVVVPTVAGLPSRPAIPACWMRAETGTVVCSSSPAGPHKGEEETKEPEQQPLQAHEAAAKQGRRDEEQGEHEGKGKGQGKQGNLNSVDHLLEYFFPDSLNDSSTDSSIPQHQRVLIGSVSSYSATTENHPHSQIQSERVRRSTPPPPPQQQHHFLTTHTQTLSNRATGAGSGYRQFSGVLDRPRPPVRTFSF